MLTFMNIPVSIFEDGFKRVKMSITPHDKHIRMLHTSFQNKTIYNIYIYS